MAAPPLSGAAALAGIAAGAAGMLAVAGAGGERHASQANTPTLMINTIPNTTAQIGKRRVGRTMRISSSAGPACRWRSFSDFFSASRINDMDHPLGLAAATVGSDC